jgi:hypothetical protein
MLVLLALLLLFMSQTQAPESATVYFYRVEEVSKLGSRKVEVKLDGKPLLSMPEDNFIAFKLPPGKYGLRMRQKQSEILLNVEAGKTYFVRVSQVEAGFGFNQSITLMPNDQAAYQMRDMKPLESKNIKNKDLEVVREKPAQ